MHLYIANPSTLVVFYTRQPTNLLRYKSWPILSFFLFRLNCHFDGKSLERSFISLLTSSTFKRELSIYSEKAFLDTGNFLLHIIPCLRKTKRKWIQCGVKNKSKSFHLILQLVHYRRRVKWNERKTSYIYIKSELVTVGCVTRSIPILEDPGSNYLQLTDF